MKNRMTIYRVFSVFLMAAGIFLINAPRLELGFAPKAAVGLLLLLGCFRQSRKLFSESTSAKRPCVPFVFLIDCLLIALLSIGIFSDQTLGTFYHRSRLSAAATVCIFLVILTGPFVYAKVFEKITLWLHGGVAAAIVFALSVFLIYPKFGVYSDAAYTKSDIFEGKRVLILVPHEDDDMNLMSGTIDQFLTHGSDIYVAFTSNGDFTGNGETRLREALYNLKKLGVPEDHVFFLGYGDQWEDRTVHIYNMPENQPLHSAFGYTATYGLPNHPAFRDGNLYTFGNYLSDIKDVILECKPEYIFCSDYDGHKDHKATSLAAEKAIGKILRENPNYPPVFVLKGFCYSTAWTAENDFYHVNIQSTQAPGGEYMEEVNFYRWDQRLRLPMDAGGLSRSIFTTTVYSQLYSYKSQNALAMATNICNGDKVYWQRSTESFAYGARVTATSGDADVINDFMLHDTRDLYQPKDDFGIWVPEETDAVKQITLHLPEKTDVAWVYLYDNPSLEDNIEAATVILEDGRRIPTGELDPSGCATKIRIDAADVQSITVEINRASGTYAGLSEIELYAREPAPAFHFVKLMDCRENFVYDYYMPDDTMELQLYRCGAVPELLPENYVVQVDNDKCRAVIEDGRITVTCPRGQKCLLTVATADGRYQDTVLLRNRFNLISIAQTIENTLVSPLLKNGFVYKINAVFPQLFSRG